MPMRRKVSLAVLLILGFVLPLLSGNAQDEFASRRLRLAGLLDTSSALVLRAADPRVRTNDVNYRYRQESNFLYLTGITEPNCYLVIVPRGIRVDSGAAAVLLFAPEKTAKSLRILDGTVLDVERFGELFAALAGSVKVLYIVAPDIHFVNDWLNGKPLFLDRDARKELEQKHPGLRIKNAGPLIARLREIKTPGEIALMQKAIDCTGDGLRSAMKICRPGATEYELQAAVEYEMIRQGAEYQSFPSIVGSGENSLILHYDNNRRLFNAGEVVVMDVGAEYSGYAADITRTLPVSGKFTQPQKEVYSVVLRTQEEVIKIIRAGATFGELERRAREVVAAAGYGRYITHGVSHHVGLDVHDVGTRDTLRAGMVITVEPGIYIPASDTSRDAGYRGFGIRIEDDVLVGENGSTILSQKIPKQVDEVERLTGK